MSLRIVAGRHDCLAEGCNAVCEPEHLFCRAHWPLVPPDLRRALHRAPNPYAFEPGTRSRPSKAWLRAVRAAGEAVRDALTEVEGVLQRLGVADLSAYPLAWRHRLPAMVAKELHHQRVVRRADDPIHAAAQALSLDWKRLGLDGSRAVRGNGTCGDVR